MAEEMNFLGTGREVGSLTIDGKSRFISARHPALIPKNLKNKAPKAFERQRSATKRMISCERSHILADTPFKLAFPAKKGKPELSLLFPADEAFRPFHQ